MRCLALLVKASENLFVKPTGCFSVLFPNWGLLVGAGLMTEYGNVLCLRGMNSNINVLLSEWVYKGSRYS